jgi:ParB-like chromosome segregation protein Spo0J
MPEIKKVNINKVKANPDNPRLIKDDKFFKLVKSIQEFPQMLDIRPIVVNDDMIVLGGNMRLKACKEAGLKEVPIIMASDLTQDQQREFIIKDNVGFGEWDWDDLANNWDVNELSNWGLDVPTFLDADETIEIDEQPKRPSIKISFDSINDVQAAENDVKELIYRKYPKAICSVII